MVALGRSESGTFDISMLQGQYINKRGWVDRPYLAIAYRLVQKQDYDLCSLLEQNGILSPEQCQEVSRAVQAYTEKKNSPEATSNDQQQLEGFKEDRVVVSIDPSLVPSEQNDLETFNVMAPKPKPKRKPKRKSRPADHTETLLFAPPSGQFMSAENSSYESYERPLFNSRDSIDSSLETAVSAPKSSDKSHFFEVGDVFEHYRIEKEIARGGMGVVFKAYCLKTEQNVAIKFILANDDIENVERFLREIKVLKKARHPCIVQILESGQHGSLFYYTMEYLRGENLVSVAAKQSRNPEFQKQLLHYLHDIAGALEHCHENGIIHRDVKPHNIVIDSDTDRAVLIDFGIMKRLTFQNSESTAGPALTKTGQFLGSPAFMSPEQFGLLDFGTVTEKSDVWSFGATMFYVLSGRTPFCESNVVRVMEAVALGVIPELKEVNSEIRPELNDLCRLCMERSHSLRPMMAEVRSRLGEILAPEEKATKLKLFASILALFLVGNIIAILLLVKNPAKVLSVEVPRLSSKLEVTVVGEVSQANALVQISRLEGERAIVLESVSADEKGRFSSSVSLFEGNNRVVVKLPEYDQSEAWIVGVQCDSTRPGFSFPRHKTEGSLLVVDESLLVYGHVNEENLESLTVDDREIPRQSGGEFEFVIPDKTTVQRLTLIAEDGAGNIGRKTIAVLTPLAIQARQKKEKPELKGSVGQRRFSLADWNQENTHWTYSNNYFIQLRMLYLSRKLTLPKPKLPDPKQSFSSQMSEDEKAAVKRYWSILSDVEQWKNAGKETQNKAIEFIAQRINGDFIFLETERFNNGSENFRIATFKHRLTGIEFNLVPGGKQKIAERVIEVAECFDLISGKTGDISHVCDTLKIIPANMLVSLGYYRVFEVDEKKSVADLIVKILETEDALSIVKSLTESLMKASRSGQGSRRNRQLKITLPEMVVGPLLVSRYEVSEEEWSQTTESNTTKSFPKVSVSVTEINEWLSRYSGTMTLRLPSRWEWTHACLGASKKPFFWEGTQLDSGRYSWSVENSKQYLHNRENLKAPNAFGLYNTLGNAEEWCTSIWQGVVKEKRQSLWPVAVGGHYNSTSLAMRASYFRYAGVNQRSYYCGFRLVVDLP